MSNNNNVAPFAQQVGNIVAVRFRGALKRPADAPAGGEPPQKKRKVDNHPQAPAQQTQAQHQYNHEPMDWE